MDEILSPEYYDVIPEFNSDGRLCNYHTGGEGETVRVMAGEWERFNQLAGRQHGIVDGVVVYNPALEPCMPDDTLEPDPLASLRAQVEAQREIIDALLGVTGDSADRLALARQVGSDLSVVFSGPGLNKN